MIGRRRLAFIRREVKEYGAVDPERREVLIHRVDYPGYRVGGISEGRRVSTAVPGFWIEVEWLWRHPLPSALDCLRQILGPGGLEEGA